MSNEEPKDETMLAIGAIRPANDNGCALDAANDNGFALVIGLKEEMTDADLKQLLGRWLKAARLTDNAREWPIEIACVDFEAQVPPGTTARLLDDALLAEGDWVVVLRTEQFIRLRYVGDAGRAAG